MKSIQNNNLNKYRQNKLLIGLLSMLFLVSPAFETSTQQCGMITVVQKKNKDSEEPDDDFNQDK